VGAPGVVLARAWLAGDAPGSGDLAAWEQDKALNPENHLALQTLQDIVGNLRRASYAGPMRLADGSVTDRVWLAVPYFDGLHLKGIYVAQLAMRQAVDALLPGWFCRTRRCAWWWTPWACPPACPPAAPTAR
jgi:two-component system sensor histidine kinase DctS